MRRAAAAFGKGDTANVQFILKGAPGGDRIDFAREVDPVKILGGAVADLYAPFEDADTRKRAAEECARIIGEAKARDEKALRDLYDEITDPLDKHRARLLDTALTALGDPSSLIPAIWLEAIEDKASLEEFRIMRDDFDALKGRYQDIFEAASRGLVFTARIVNLARRGDPSAHVDGESRTLHKALNKTTAFHREAWLTDFPAAETLYGRMKRHTRNDIGHRLVRYDFASGDLVYDDGSKETYIHFLTDYLHAVRLSHHLLDVCELMWHTDRVLNR